MDFSRLQELIEIFEESGLTEIEIEEAGHRMRLQKTPPAVITQPFLPGPASHMLMADALSAEASREEEVEEEALDF